MKKNLHLGFIVICGLIIISNIFLFWHSRKGEGVLREIISDITPGAIAMVEMANHASDIGHYSLHCAIAKDKDPESLERLQTATHLLREQGEIHLLHEKHIGLKEQKAAEELLVKINTLSKAAEFFSQPGPEMNMKRLQKYELNVVHPAIDDLNTLLLIHKNVHLLELSAAHASILSKKNTLNMVILNSSIILLSIIILIWWMTIGIHNRFSRKQKIQQKQIELDFLEKKHIAEKLHQARKMESIGLMAGGVAHDLNNILSGVTGYSELILYDLPKDSKLRKPLEAIQDSGSRAAAVVADLLTVARGVATSRTVHNLTTLTQEYLGSPEFDTLQSLHQQITYQQKLAAIHSPILCSSVHVKKCLMNLVTNASEAVDATGTVSIITENKTIDNETATRYHIHPGEYGVLSVQDNGPGIDDKDLERIFEPFYTRKVMGRSGTGLGLTVVWNTMKEHDGGVSVESTNEGTCFQLFFPLTTEKKHAKIDDDTLQDIKGNGSSVLLVDDEPQLREIGTQMLETLGYKVISVASGELALSFCEKNTVDLLVLDMLMEPGMNGRQTFDKIRQIHPEQKAIITSGFSENEDVKEAFRHGVSGFIKKPYSMMQLGRAVRDALID